MENLFGPSIQFFHGRKLDSSGSTQNLPLDHVVKRKRKTICIRQISFHRVKTVCGKCSRISNWGWTSLKNQSFIVIKTNNRLRIEKQLSFLGNDNASVKKHPLKLGIALTKNLQNFKRERKKLYIGIDFVTVSAELPLKVLGTWHERERERNYFNNHNPGMREYVYPFRVHSKPKMRCKDERGRTESTVFETVRKRSPICWTFEENVRFRHNQGIVWCQWEHEWDHFQSAPVFISIASNHVNKWVEYLGFPIDSPLSNQ